MAHRLKLILALLVLMAVLVGMVTAQETAVSLLTVHLKAQQTVTITCEGDELIVYPAGNNEMQVVCRVWVNVEEN